MKNTAMGERIGSIYYRSRDTIRSVSESMPPKLLLLGKSIEVLSGGGGEAMTWYHRNVVINGLCGAMSQQSGTHRCGVQFFVGGFSSNHHQLTKKICNITAKGLPLGWLM
jgi:hypothetical protein